MATITIRITTDRTKTEYYFTDRVAAYKYALHMAEAGYEDVEIREGV